MPESDSDNFESADEDVPESKPRKSLETQKTPETPTEPPKPVETSSWKSWSAFGMISSASKSVASVTTKMTQSLSTAIESINIPDPEEMAKIHVDQKSPENPAEPTEEASVFKLDSLLSNVGMISSKVVSGGLDTLEGIGKKTMTILQDTDPNIKSKLRSITESNRPNLSEILAEAKSLEVPNEIVDNKTVTFEHRLEDNSGLVYFEALELLSRQSQMKIELLLKPLTGKLLAEMEETLKEVEELCEVPDAEAVNEHVTLASLNEHLEKSIEDLNVAVSFKDISGYALELEKSFSEANFEESEPKVVYNESIEALAKFCSFSLHNYQKLAELMLSLSHRSTADEVDAVVQLTTVYFSLFNHIATLYSAKIANFKTEASKKLSTEVFIESTNAVSHVRKAFNVLIPILQLGAL